MEYNYNYSNQPNYGMNNSGETYLKARGERKALKIIGTVSGICVIAYVILQNAVSVPIILFPSLRTLFDNSDEFFYIFTIVASVVGLFIPFLTGGKYLMKKTGAEIYYFSSPKDPVLAFLSIPMGFFVCLIGNIITAYFLAWTQSIGFELTAPDYKTPQTASGIILYTIAIAVIPPLIEEFAIRGCILQPLRRYGEKFAIAATSVLFAILHGNLVQAPFALIAGLALGYVCCITGSLWPSVIIHLVNNMYSVFESLIISSSVGEEKAEMIMSVTEYVFIGIGAVCTLLFFYRVQKFKLRLKKTQGVLTPGAKTSAFFINIPMIIAIIVMLIITSQYIGLV